MTKAESLGLWPTVIYLPILELAFAMAYAGAIWISAFALIGLAVGLLSRPSGAVRYIADASYWIYLAHLPLVYAL